MWTISICIGLAGEVFSRMLGLKMSMIWLTNDTVFIMRLIRKCNLRYTSNCKPNAWSQTAMRWSGGVGRGGGFEHKKYSIFPDPM